MKQCSKIDLTDRKEYGLVFVSTLSQWISSLTSPHILSIMFSKCVSHNTCFVYISGTLFHFPLLYRPSFALTAKAKHLQHTVALTKLKFDIKFRLLKLSFRGSLS